MEEEAAAAALGLHVVEVDCRSLSSSSPMDEAECIMHLQNIIRSVRLMHVHRALSLLQGSYCMRIARTSRSRRSSATCASPGYHPMKPCGQIHTVSPGLSDDHQHTL